MAARRHGAIVNVASVAGMTSGPIHAYTAAKAGIIQITQTLAAESGRTGVRVNAALLDPRALRCWKPASPPAR